MTECLGKSLRCLYIVTGGKRVRRIEAYSHPALILYLIYNIGDLLEGISQVRALPRRILYHGTYATRLSQRDIDRLGDARQAGIHLHLPQMASGMEIQHFQSQLLAACHLVQKSVTGFLQSLGVRVPQIDQIAIVRQDTSRIVTVRFTPLLK